jgi:hypothetical protein
MKAIETVIFYKSIKILTSYNNHLENNNSNKHLLPVQLQQGLAIHMPPDDGPGHRAGNEHG